MELRHHSSFNMGGIAKHLVEVHTKEELRNAVKQSQELGTPFHVLGGGTNTVFHNTEVNKFVIKNKIPGVEITGDTIKVGAGVSWDHVVAITVKTGLSGIEAMSAIPGTMGAAPVQNIGAYGQEIKDTLTEVEVYNVEKDTFEILTSTQCEFAYRDSVFKKNPDKYIVTSVTLKLSYEAPKIPHYPGVNISEPNLEHIRNAIIEIRKSKLPDPSIVPNCGSFFKNAIISKKHFEQLKETYPNIPHFPSGDQVKIPTGWLLEQAGFKGKLFGNFKTHDKNALVMTHIGTGTLDELKATVKEIQDKINEMFGIEIEMEANIVE